MTNLTDKRCVPCEGGVEPLSRERSQELMRELKGGWSLNEEGTAIEREYRFPAFSRTIAFVNVVAWIATVEGHHPELVVNYGTCRVRYTTTAIGGLSENDFICAAKIDRIASEDA